MLALLISATRNPGYMMFFWRQLPEPRALGPAEFQESMHSSGYPVRYGHHLGRKMTGRLAVTLDMVSAFPEGAARSSGRCNPQTVRELACH